MHKIVAVTTTIHNNEFTLQEKQDKDQTFTQTKHTGIFKKCSVKCFVHNRTEREESNGAKKTNKYCKTTKAANGKIRTRQYIFCFPVEKLFAPPRKNKRTPDLDFTPLLLHCLGAKLCVWVSELVHVCMNSSGQTPLTGFYFYEGMLSDAHSLSVFSGVKEKPLKASFDSLYISVCVIADARLFVSVCMLVFTSANKVAPEVTPIVLHV